jgi:hypothetical protein
MYMTIGIWEKTFVCHVQEGGGSLFRIFFGESVRSPLALPHLDYSQWAKPQHRKQICLDWTMGHQDCGQCLI